MENQAIITFTKNIKLGNVKTRIASSVGEEKALSIYKELLEFTEELLNSIPYTIYIYWDSYIPSNLEFFSNHFFNHKVQKGKELGERMENAFKDIFLLHQKVLIIGTDCPYLQKQHISEAFLSLDTYDYCIGPALDGGYYLLGLNNFLSDWFQNISWSTNKVFSQTQKVGLKNNLKGFLLPQLSDIDNENDYNIWKIQKTKILKFFNV